MTVHKATCAGSMHLLFRIRRSHLHLHPVELRRALLQHSRVGTAESSTTPAHSIHQLPCQSVLPCQTVQGQSQCVPTQHPNNLYASGPSRLHRRQTLVRLSLRVHVKVVVARKWQHQSPLQSYQPRGHAQTHHGQMRRLLRTPPPVHQPQQPPQPRAQKE